MPESSDHRILVLVPDPRVKGGVTHYYATLGLDREEGVEYFAVNRHDTVGMLEKIRGLPSIYWRFVRELPGCSLIHVNPSLDPKSFYRDAVFIALARLFRKPYLVFFRGWSEGYEAMIHRKTLLRWIFRMTYARADLYVVLGRVFGERLRRLRVNPSAPVHVETTVAGSRALVPEELEQKLRTLGEGVHILFLSRILQRKGILIALDAFAGCRSAFPGVPLHFWVAGEGEFLEEAREYARSHGYADVTFLGNVAGAEKADLLRKCHILLFPTYYGEGLPNAILECMLNGMVVISRPMGGIPEVIEHGVHGFLSTSVESAVFAGFLQELVGDPDRLARMARTNLTTAEERFTTDHVRARILALYRTLLAPASPRGPAPVPPAAVDTKPLENHNP